MPEPLLPEPQLQYTGASRLSIQSIFFGVEKQNYFGKKVLECIHLSDTY